MACDGISLRLEGGRETCIPLLIAAERRGGLPEPPEAGERNLRDLVTLAAVLQTASGLFDGDLRERIGEAVRTGIKARLASELPPGVVVSQVAEARRS